MIFWIWMKQGQNTERKIQLSTDKNLSKMNILKAQNFISWTGSTTNELMLSFIFRM